MQYEKEKLLTITKAGKACALCGQSLEAEAKHLSVLKKSEKEAEAPKPEQPQPRSRKEKAAAAKAATEASADAADSGAGGENEDDLVRTDYHRDCWKKVQRGDYLSFWLATRPEPPATPKMTRQERNTILLGLFSALIQKSDTIDEPAKFIVSHLLMKYKVLVLAGSRVDEQQRRRWIIFEIPQTEEKFEIPDIRLSDEQAADTLARINAYLDHAHAQGEGRPKAEEDEEQGQ